MRPDKKPKMLYRKVNTRARGVHHRAGGDYRHDRNTKAEQQAVADGVATGPMHIKAQRGKPGAKTQRGLDYTPLFRFLLGKVGQPWAPVEQEAMARLDKPDPIYWMVARDPDDRYPVFVAGESSHFSRLTVDAEGRLVKINPDLGPQHLWPRCRCCTHTFNGAPFANPWVFGRYHVFDENGRPGVTR